MACFQDGIYALLRQIRYMKPRFHRNNESMFLEILALAIIMFVV